MTVFLLFIAAAVALMFSAFFSGTETGFLSVSRERILHLAREGGRKAKIVQTALADMGRTTTTILIGNNIANVSYSSATAAIAAELITIQVQVAGRKDCIASDKVQRRITPHGSTQENR